METINLLFITGLWLLVVLVMNVGHKTDRKLHYQMGKLDGMMEFMTNFLKEFDKHQTKKGGKKNDNR